MEYLIRLAQMHETFRRPELEALAVLHNVDLEILEYADEVWQRLSFSIHLRVTERIAMSWLSRTSKENLVLRFANKHRF